MKINSLNSVREDPMALQFLNEVIHFIIVCLISEIGIKDLVLALFAQGIEVNLSLTFDTVILHRFLFLKYILSVLKQLLLISCIKLVPVVLVNLDQPELLWFSLVVSHRGVSLGKAWVLRGLLFSFHVGDSLVRRDWVQV